MIQTLYNIIDSLFIGKYSESGLTELSIIYPVQLLMIAPDAVTCVGINTSVAYYLGVKKQDQALTALGLYYKWQTFFFIPLDTLQTCIMPVISYNYVAAKTHAERPYRQRLLENIMLMTFGTLCFEPISSQCSF